MAAVRTESELTLGAVRADGVEHEMLLELETVAWSNILVPLLE